ncbi:30S ribosomal protein S13 [Candidatus Woesearchaeota archaeon]|nr:30S ribosomal protein S13 [Candidatus Woesearchaeota archaeon]
MEKDNQTDFKHFVRVANTDLKGDKPISSSLRQIKGISFMFSNLVCHLAKIDKTAKTGYLKEDEITRINEVIENPLKSGIPSWMLNRRKDPETGKDTHLISSDLIFSKDNDIKRMKKIKSYRGIRHILGQPSRGQKTRSNFRANKGKIHLGVKKKAGVKSGRP